MTTSATRESLTALPSDERLRAPAGEHEAFARGSARVLLISLEPIGARIGGAAVRTLELARVLSASGCSTTVATPVLLADAAEQPFALRPFERARPRAALQALVDASDVVVLPWHGLFEIPFLERSRAVLVVDLCDPVILEVLEAAPDAAGGAAQRLARDNVKMLNQALDRGDFFLCASERQRDLWLGALLSRGRIVRRDPHDATLRSLIDVVPFGMSAHAATCGQAASSPLRSGGLAIARESFVLLWGGGLWEWLDPATPIAAVALLRDRVDVHLVFLGVKHPTPGRSADDSAAARALARELEVEGRVHFLPGWIPYDERAPYLLDGDAGVTAHGAHLESRFAFRTRVMDYLWAGLPVICTAGDVLADLVEREGLGIVVPERDPAALADAVARLAEDRDYAAACRRRIENIRPRLTWDVAARPLIRFCREPKRTATGSRALGARLGGGAHLLRTALGVLASHGPLEVGRRTRRLLRLGLGQRSP